MKSIKLVVVLSLILTATVLKAASLSWEVYPIQAPENLTSMSAFLLDGSKFANGDADVLSAINSWDTEALINSAYVWSSLPESSSPSGNYLAGGLMDFGGGEYYAGTSGAYGDSSLFTPKVDYTFYNVILAETSDGEKLYIMSKDVIEGPEIGASLIVGVNYTGVAWTAVPEPTSGLLLLVGGALLALRRKQK